MVARSTGNDPNHERDGQGQLLDIPIDGRPALVVGTFDKALRYDAGVIAEQHFRFHESLRDAQRLVVVGYGFRDKGINTRLIDWTVGSPNRRLVVVHGNEKALTRGARPAVQGKWETWRSEGRLVVISHMVGDTDWLAIRSSCA